MSETPEQTAARFKAKDEEYAARARNGKWPMLECDDCRHYSCMNPSCGHSTPAPILKSNECGRCKGPMVQSPACCKRAWHHRGDCCTHCGNDERR